MKVAFLGNHAPTWSTESHLAGSFELEGHEVTRIQEGEVPAWPDIPALVAGHDLFVWVQTLGLAQTGGSIDERFKMLETIRALGIPSVGYHLDRWHGLERQDSIAREPYFRQDHLFTADGGHDEEWAAAGVNHHWLPPGVYEPECVAGTPRAEFTRDVGFVGSWMGHYHRESRHRFELVRFLRQTYRRRLGLWPTRERRMVGEIETTQIRGLLLADLYASVKVVVGDSCMLPGDRGSYISDRIPETLGRGGFLLHPHIEGVTDGTHYTPGEHLVTWPAGDWRELRRLIDYYVEHEDERRAIAEEGQRHVIANHTYSTRVRSLLKEVGL